MDRKRACFACCAAGLIVLVWPAFGGWRESLTDPAPGPFPMVRPFDAEFRFGWSEIEAARASARFRIDGGRMAIEASGGTSGLARTLWQLDASHEAYGDLGGLRSDWFQQTERYVNRSIFTCAAFKPDGVWRFRQVSIDPPEKARWKRTPIEPIRDLFATMLFIRSQPLRDGDVVRCLTFPGDAPFLVTIKVLDRARLAVGGESRDAIKLDLDIQRVGTKGDRKDKLEPHRKFRSGRIWLSDDADRFPLRAEVDLFIGYVFAEVERVTFR